MIFKKELIKLINLVQDEVRDDFTFRFDFIGSASRNMITREVNGNVGYDFDVNIRVNDDDEDYYLINKKNNFDSNKKSRSIFAETESQDYNENKLQ